MKKFTSLLIGCSLALAAAAFAEPPQDQRSPAAAEQGKGKGKHHAEATQGAGAHAGANAQGGAPSAEKKQRRAENRAERKAAKQNQNADTSPKAVGPTGEKGSAGAESNVSGEAKTKDADTKTDADANAGAGADATTDEGQGKQHQGRKGRNAHNAKNKADKADKAGANAAAETNANANAKAEARGEKNAKGKVKKAETHKLQEIKSQHANFKAQPKPEKVPPVQFSVNYRIENSDRWQGPKYEVFRSYRPERHDEHWYHSHYTRVELIGGGYYYWNNGYWYPAWGYSPVHEYYAYNGPIYVGQRAVPPDQVIADVQAELQYLGYYTGEVDGLLGPLTRQALTEYQEDNGLFATAAIDEPTLDSLGMG